MSKNEQRERLLSVLTEEQRGLAERSPEILAKAEAEAKTKEQAYKERKRKNSERVLELLSTLKEKEVSINAVLDKRDELRAEMFKKEGGSLLRLINFVKLNELRKKMSFVDRDVDRLRQEQKELQDLLLELGAEQQDKRELDEIDNIIRNFKGEMTQKYEEFVHNEKARNLKNVCVENNALVLHAMVASDEQLKHVSVLRNKGEGISFEAKLKIILGLEPSLSSSSIRLPREESNEGAFDDTIRSMGIIVGEGRIKSATLGDSGSQVQGLDRGVNYDDLALSQTNIKEEIDRSVNRKNGRYNEVVVEHPRVAGIFITDYSGTTKSDGEHEHRNQVVEAAHKMNMPIYFRRASDNRFFTAILDERTQQLKMGEEVGVQDILENGYSITEEERGMIREEIFADCPFNLNMPERRIVDAYRNGIEEYNKFKSTPAGMPLDEKKRLLKQYSFGPGAEGTINIGSLSFRAKEICLDVTSFVKGLGDMVDGLDQLSRIEDAKADYERALRRLKEATEDDVGAVKISTKQITQLKEDVEKTKKSLQISKEQFGEFLVKTSYFLEGIKKEALENGDTETLAQVDKLIRKLDGRATTLEGTVYEQLAQSADHQNVLSRRIGDDGKFRMTEQDLKHITSV